MQQQRPPKHLSPHGGLLVTSETKRVREKGRQEAIMDTKKHVFASMTIIGWSFICIFVLLGFTGLPLTVLTIVALGLIVSTPISFFVFKKRVLGIVMLLVAVIMLIFVMQLAMKIPRGPIIYGKEVDPRLLCVNPDQKICDQAATARAAIPPWWPFGH